MNKRKCPVCGGETREEEFTPSKDMCNRCWWYLSPDSNGFDLGYLMYRTKIAGYGGLRTMEVRPRGFWGDVIQVSERFSIFAEPNSKVEVEVHWTSGGADASLSSIDTAESFKNGLAFAVGTAMSWRSLNENKG